MEPTNVNNLNGVPNFGHGFAEAEVPTPAPEETKEAEVVPETEGETVELPADNQE